MLILPYSQPSRPGELDRIAVRWVFGVDEGVGSLDESGRGAGAGAEDPEFVAVEVDWVGHLGVES